MSHPYEKLCWVEDGRGEFIYRNHVEQIHKGTLLRVPAGLQHRFVDSSDAPLTLSMLCLELAALKVPSHLIETWHKLIQPMQLGTSLQIPNSYWEREIQRLFRTITLELGQSRVEREAMVVSLALQLIVIVCRIAGEQQSGEKCQQLSPAFLASVTELEDRFADALQISELADKAGMCYRSYTENFRRYKGMTVTQYLTLRRVEFSKRRMIETGDIMGSALEAGFGDLSHFYRTFKRYVGHTPLEFIRFNRNPPSHP